MSSVVTCTLAFAQRSICIPGLELIWVKITPQALKCTLSRVQLKINLSYWRDPMKDKLDILTNTLWCPSWTRWWVDLAKGRTWIIPIYCQGTITHEVALPQFARSSISSIPPKLFHSLAGNALATIWLKTLLAFAAALFYLVCTTPGALTAAPSSLGDAVKSRNMTLHVKSLWAVPA